MIDDHEAEQPRTGEQEGAAGDPASGGPASAREFVTAGEPAVDEDIRLGEAERALLQWALRQRQRNPGEPLLPHPKPPAAPPSTSPVPPLEVPPLLAPEESAPPAPEAPPPPPAQTAAPPTPEQAAPPAPEQAASPAPDAPRAARSTPTPAPRPTPPAREPSPATARESEPASRTAEAEPPSARDRFHGSAEEAISALVAAGGPDPRDYASPRLNRRAKVVIAFALVLLFVVSAVGGFVGYRLTHRAAGGPETVGGHVGIHAGPAAPSGPGV
jgi:outer membrane biosynthesis protein TonB